MDEHERPATQPIHPPLDALKALYAADRGDDFSDDEVPAATHWPAIPVADAEDERGGLRAWGIELKARFDSIDHHVVPDCWWRHNEHVEALSALRDHERASFSEMAPATAPVDWFRALRDITALLRAWTGLSGCGGTHTPPPTRRLPDTDHAFVEYVKTDIERRARATATSAV